MPMKAPYPLFWLEKLTSTTYNPFSTEFRKGLELEKADELSEDIQKEQVKILDDIRNIYFAGADLIVKDQIRRYYASLKKMSMQVSQYQVEISGNEPGVSIVYKALQECIGNVTESMEEDYGEEILGNPKKQLEPGSVLINLNTDQIALLLRAATESGLLHTLSMSAVFRNVIPHISTPDKKQISWNTTRTKAYEAEDRNIEIAISALEGMLKKLKTYHSGR